MNNSSIKQQKGQFYISNTNSTVSGNQVNFRLPYQIQYNKINLESASLKNPLVSLTNGFNIAAALNNNIFSYGSIFIAAYPGAVGVLIVIPDGIYTGTSLCAYLNPRINNGAGTQLMALTYNGGSNTITVSSAGGTTHCQILRPGITPTIYDKLYTAMGLLPSLLRPNTTYDLFTSTYEAPYGHYASYPGGTLTGGQVNLAPVEMLILNITSPQFEQQLETSQKNPAFSIVMLPQSVAQLYQRGHDQDNDIMLANDQRLTLSDIQLNFFNGENPVTLDTFVFKFSVYG